MSVAMSMPSGQATVIVKVTFAYRQITISPDVAYARVGQAVQWEVSSDEAVIWEVYFDHGSPFSSSHGVLNSGCGKVSLGNAQQPGDYKYGVRVVSPTSHETLGDDDPMLIVRL